VTSSLSTKILPLVALSSPAIILNDVVLPHPDGPSNVVKVPASKLQLTLSTATVSLNFFGYIFKFNFSFFHYPKFPCKIPAD